MLPSVSLVAAQADEMTRKGGVHSAGKDARP
jgi:hypothetical protein